MVSKIYPANFITLFISILFLLSVVSSCSLFKQIPVHEQINIKDSVVVNTIDSIVYIPKEVIKDIVPIYDTLELETSKAKAEAYVDTVYHVLRGNIENKEGVEYKYIYKDKIIYKDSIITKEIPIYTEVEKIKYKHFWYERILWTLSGLFLLSILLKYIKNKYGGFFRRV